MADSLIQLGGAARKWREPKPEWLRVRMPGGGRYEQVKRTLRELNLHTVCEEASCPNVGECWGGGTATVMLMGDVCTRGCRFCDVSSGLPAPLDPLEPRHLAEAVGRLGLDYLVVTSVNRDELEDGGASHFAQAIVELRRAAPKTLVEVLTPDFQGSRDALQMIVDAQPTVAAHNVETVERLTPRVRDRRATYRQSLDVLDFYKRSGMRTKSSIMLGLGETHGEVITAMRDLRSVGCDILTLGQYLRPSEKHLAVEEFVRPEVFSRLEREGLALGFRLVAAAIGMAMYGLRPVPEIQFSDFIFPAFDQIVNELAKLRYRSGGQYAAPVVIRTPVGGGIKGGHYHSQSPEALFIHTPGLQVLCPSNPIDAKGLLISAIRQDDPVIFMEPKRVYRAARGDVPEGEYTVPIGEAKVVREGSGMTVIGWGAMFHEAQQAVEQDPQLDAELIDLRTLWPLDIETLARSVRKTGRCAIVQEAPKTCGFAAQISALVQERCFTSLQAPVSRITGWDTPFPYPLENDYLPLAPRILRSLRELKAYEA